jgi:hypothetical protein
VYQLYEGFEPWSVEILALFIRQAPCQIPTKMSRLPFKSGGKDTRGSMRPPTLLARWVHVILAGYATLATFIIFDFHNGFWCYTLA